ASSQDVYQRWLDEDVVYIIRDEERAAFQSLRTTAERDEFIEQFWQRRDPTPGTLDNEFRDEHYRRIAYANSHFQAAQPFRPGWRTDRGRIYIRFGPPNQLEEHAAGTYIRPDGTVQPWARQLWLYKYIEGVGIDVLIEFADTKGTGEYPMTTAPALRRE